MMSSSHRTSRQESRVNSGILAGENNHGLASVHEVDPRGDIRWQSLVERHPHGSIFHHVGWLNALYRSYGYEPTVFTTSPSTSDLENGMLFCRIRSWVTGSRIVSLPFSDHCAPLCDWGTEFGSLIGHLQATRVKQNWKYVEIRPVNGEFDGTAKKLGFETAGKYILHCIDLEPAAEEIFRRLHKDSVQRRIRHAERFGVVEVCGRSQGLLKDFFRLMVRTRARHNLPPQPYHWFKNVLECMGDAADVRLAYMQNVPVAAILALHFKGASYYKYACTDERFHHLGAMPFLLWRLILKAKSIGSRTLDLGRTGSDDSGLITFKNHWTSISQQLTYSVFPSDQSPTFIKDWKLTMFKHFCALLPNGALTAAGRLIYRHIG